MSAVRYARRVSASESALMAVPAPFIHERRWSPSPETFDLGPLERWLILRAWTRGARRADA